MSEKRKWIITASGERSLSELKKELTDNGLKVEETMDEIGIISGEADEEAAKKMRSVRGVADVSPDNPIDIGPPDAPVTW